jgi:uncharacterized RDD family membrane protein YckC
MSHPSDQPTDPYFNPPPGAVKVETAPFLGYAGFWRRFFAWFLDNIILGAVAGVLTPVILSVAPSSLREGLEGTLPFASVSVISFLIGVAYHSVMNCSTFQASLGKIVLGAKVVDMNGMPLTYGRAIVRECAKLLSGLLLGIGYIIAAFTQRKQALHDMIAGTLVIKSR